MKIVKVPASRAASVMRREQDCYFCNKPAPFVFYMTLVCAKCKKKVEKMVTAK